MKYVLNLFKKYTIQVFNNEINNKNNSNYNNTVIVPQINSFIRTMQIILKRFFYINNKL